MVVSKFRLAKIVVVLMITSSIIACQKNDPVKNVDSQKPEAGAHAISTKDEKLLMKQTNENIDIMTAATTDTSILKKALAGDALSTFSDRIKKDLGQGKIKIRKYDSVKLEVKNITKGVAGLNMTFTDRSYYVDKDSQERISPPVDSEEAFILASRKIGKRWKIFSFFTTKLKDKDRQE